MKRKIFTVPSLYSHTHTSTSGIHSATAAAANSRSETTKKVKKKNEEIVAEHQRNPTICYFIFSALKLHIRDNDSHIHRTQKKITHIHFPVCCTFSMQLYMRASHTGFHLQKPKSAWESVSIGRTIIAYTHCSLDDDGGGVPCVREREFYILFFRFCDGSKEQTQNCTVILKPEHTREAGKTKLSKAHTQFIC